jgi:hypothetical protein
MAVRESQHHQEGEQVHYPKQEGTRRNAHKGRELVRPPQQGKPHHCHYNQCQVFKYSPIVLTTERVHILLCQHFFLLSLQVFLCFTGVSCGEATVGGVHNVPNNEHNKANNESTRQEFIEENADERPCKHYRHHHEDVVELEDGLVVDGLGHKVGDVGGGAGKHGAHHHNGCILGHIVQEQYKYDNGNASSSKSCHHCQCVHNQEQKQPGNILACEGPDKVNTIMIE